MGYGYLRKSNCLKQVEQLVVRGLEIAIAMHQNDRTTTNSRIDILLVSRFVTCSIFTLALIPHP